MVELKQKYVIYLVDIDPDTGDVSQMKAVAYAELENYAVKISEFLSSIDDGGDGSRNYKWTKL